MSDNIVVAVSGGMDPPHRGHIQMLQEASKKGKVVLILNSDKWLIKKKGYSFMKFDERKYILEAYDFVWKVMSVDDSDGTVCQALEKLKPDYFANGGDRKNDNTPEADLCEKLGIKMLWNVGGGKIQSSSELINSVIEVKGGY